MRRPQSRVERVMWCVGGFLLAVLVAAVYAVLTSPWFRGLF